jgi:selenocysteine lyase/cysteine desulfurase
MSKVLLKPSRPRLTLYGLATRPRRRARPTFAFRLKDVPPRAVSEKLDAEGFYVWDGNYYALEAARRLGVEGSGGMVRAGGVHYNNPDDIDRFAKALLKIAHG